jgi:Flp pilus assembly protein TadG
MSRNGRHSFRHAIRALKARIAGELPREQSGQALIEAALVFPLLLGLFLGVSEFSEAFTVSRRLEAAAGMAADFVARSQVVTTADLNGIKAMVDETIKPFPTASLGLVLTSVVADGAAVTLVAWSDAKGAGVSPHAAGGAISLPSGLMLPNTSLIVAEVKYGFSSTLSTMIVGSVPLGAKAYQRPRLGLAVAKEN